MEDMISEEEAIQALRRFALSVRYLWERYNTELRMRTMVDIKALERDELKMQKEWKRVGKELIAALKAPGFGECKSQYLDDISILTEGFFLCRLEHKLKEKKLRVEDALNATKAVVEEGIVVGGDCTLLRLAAKVDAIQLTLDNHEQKVRVDIAKRALSYLLKLISKYTSTNISITLAILKNVLYINCNVKY
ncbi:hypothetical protein GIB67_033500 [Kingdonia uniflora]|uniref:Uncharacterized protein n=1 Tax=Kingdonia uniflora TaxID=39325 RepID=A0A7J7L623_9MAGN|nr:hypothetical protein GIB67_033500 [Kingdonia uniflora]